MSRDNVEVVRRWIESLGTPTPVWDAHGDDARIRNYAEDAPLDIAGAVYEGPEAAQRWWHDVADVFEEVRLELECDPIAVDAHRVLAVHHFQARYPHTQLEGPGVTWASVHTLRDGKIIDSVGYASVEAAYAAVGARAPSEDGQG